MKHEEDFSNPTVELPVNIVRDGSIIAEDAFGEVLEASP